MKKITAKNALISLIIIFFISYPIYKNHKYDKLNKSYNELIYKNKIDALKIDSLENVNNSIKDSNKLFNETLILLNDKILNLEKDKKDLINNMNIYKPSNNIIDASIELRNNIYNEKNNN